MNIITNFIVNKFANREPDEIVGGKDEPYLKRWFIVKKGWINIYLHQFLRSDDDRALHDHPGDNISMILSGSYKEWMPLHPWYQQFAPPGISSTFKVRRPGQIIFRRAEKLHRIELLKSAVRDESGRVVMKDGLFQIVEKPVWTLFWRFRHRREWGFACAKGWRHWKEFTAAEDRGQIGRGCD